MQSSKFLLGQGVYRTIGWGSAFVQSDFEIVGSMVSYFASLGFTEYVCKVMVVFGNGTHVDLCLGSGCGMTSDLRERDPELETIRAFELACMRIRSCIDEGYSRGFPWCYRRKGFRRFWDRVQRVWKGC